MNTELREQITLAGGCFWCIEAVFDELRGVDKLESGYTGGSMPDPTYRAVCDGETGHAEAVRVTFDPSVISLDDLLRVFFVAHDPTTLDRQGADVGSQYRSAIYYDSPEQRAIAEKVMLEVERDGLWSAPLVTELEPLGEFYPAEEYHRDYYRNNPNQGYCRVVIEPKVAKVRKEFRARLKRA